MAFDIKYHLACLISAERSAESSITQQSQPESDLSLLLSDMEIVEILELELNDSTGKILNMNDINATYINLLEENGVKNLRSDDKKHLTNLIQENIPNVHFNRPDDRTKPLQVLSLQTKEKVISRAAASPKLVEKDSLAIIMKTSHVIRKDILEHGNSWQFSGKFSDYEPPPLTFILCKHIIQGTRIIETKKRKDLLDRSASLLAQHMVQALKTDRQVSYEPKNQSANFGITKEAPLSVAVPLTIHKKTRSKQLVQRLSTCLSFNKYIELMKLENQLATAVCKKITEQGGVYLPPFSVENKPVYFAQDNTDFEEATPDGTNTLHG